jgi:hypothetical protein
MKRKGAKQNIRYQSRFSVVKFATGVLVLGAIWFAASLAITSYTQGFADRVTGYVDRPDYMTYTNETSRISFEYPSTLTPKVDATTPGYITFKQLDVDKRVLASNASHLYVSLLVQDQIEGYEQSQDDYFAKQTSRFCKTVELTANCTNERRLVNGSELLITKNTSSPTTINWSVYIWTSERTYELSILGKMDDINKAYVERIISSMKVGESYE